MPFDRLAGYFRRRAVMEAIRGELDAEFYYARYVDVAETGVDPVAHYVRHGAIEGRDPCREFSTEYYLAANPDVVRAKVNPFWHFVVAGRAEGRAGRPTAHVPSASDDPLREEFDREFYLRRYPDVKRADVDPLEHFKERGVHEGRDPTPWFSTAYYVDANPDVVASGLNPFVHYLMAGRAEGRAPKPDDGWRSGFLRSLRPFEETVRDWRASASTTVFAEVAVIADKVEAAVRRAEGKCAISFSHDNYLKVAGGIQLCVARESQAMRNAGFMYLNLRPAVPLPSLADPDAAEALAVSLVLDDQDLGTIRMVDLLSVLRSASFSTSDQPAIILHSLLGHAPEAVIEMAAVLGTQQVYFWLHDYFAHCPGYTLMRNDVAYCHGPPENSAACGICRYGKARPAHLRRFSALFEALDVHVCSPSQSALDIWQESAPHVAASMQVVPHLEVWESDAPRSDVSTDKGTVRIGFVGTPAAHKGWHVFEELATRFGKANTFSFHYFGVHDVAEHFDAWPVHVSQKNPDAMIEALRDAGVDLVINWAEWPETYSLSTFEALAAGAWVITNAGSGNVARIVESLGRGVVLEDVDALFALFEDKELLSLAAQARRMPPIQVRFSDMTLPLLQRFESSRSKRGAA